MFDLTHLEDTDKINELIEEKIKAHKKDLRKAREGKIPSELKKQFQLEILKNARIILSTLQSGGFSLLEDSCRGEIGYLIVDEACQATETACLMPL
jgi:superfamily I DNA and/or RNA helicase